MTSFSYEVYKFDKDCINFSIIICYIILFVLSIVFIPLVCMFFANEDYDFSIFVVFLFGWIGLFCLISQRRKLISDINKQKFCKIIVNEDSSVELIGNSCENLKLNLSDIVKNEITRIGVSMHLGGVYGFESCLIKLGLIKFTTKSGEVHSIIISNINDFLSNTVYQNVVNTKLF